MHSLLHKFQHLAEDKKHVDLVSDSAAGHKDVTTTLNICAEEFEEANAVSVETVSSCISIPSANKTEE